LQADDEAVPDEVLQNVNVRVNVLQNVNVRVKVLQKINVQEKYEQHLDSHAAHVMQSPSSSSVTSTR
jgi:hypothetical protein